MINELAITATTLLGVFTGSLTLEGFVLVPFWRSLEPDAFFSLHQEFGHRLFRYFAPLTTLAVLTPIMSAILQRHDRHAPFRWMTAGLALSVLLSFPLFFQKLNTAFATRTVADKDLAAALQRWAFVHTIRTIVALLAFIVSVTTLTLK